MLTIYYFYYYYFLCLVSLNLLEFGFLTDTACDKHHGSSLQTLSDTPLSTSYSGGGSVSCPQGHPQGLKMWTHNRWGAERAWGRWYVILITTLPLADSEQLEKLVLLLYVVYYRRITWMIVLHLLQLNGSVSYYRKWKLISSEVGVKLKNRENSKFSEKN